ncbi:hypothetical protein pb186bvf_010321 [Paramecium bursaria]
MLIQQEQVTINRFLNFYKAIGFISGQPELIFFNLSIIYKYNIKNCISNLLNAFQQNNLKNMGQQNIYHIFNLLYFFKFTNRITKYMLNQQSSYQDSIYVQNKFAQLSISDQQQYMELEENNDFDQNLFGKVENLELHKAINTINTFEYEKESTAPLMTIYKQFAETYIDQDLEKEFQYYSLSNEHILQILGIVNPQLIDSQNLRKDKQNNQFFNLKIIHAHLSIKKMHPFKNGKKFILNDQAKQPFQYMIQQIMLNYIFEIETKQSDQIVHNALILIQGEWMEFNSFLYAVSCYNLAVSQIQEVEKPKKVVFINLTGHDTKSNHQFWDDTNKQMKNSKAIYISFVLDDQFLDDQFLEENQPSQKKYIIPIKRRPIQQDWNQQNTGYSEIEYIFEEFLYEVVEGSYAIFLQLGVNSELQLNQTVVQNIVNKLTQLSNQKLIVQIQIIKHDRNDRIQQEAQKFLELYNAVLEGVQGPSKYQNLPSLYNFSTDYWQNLQYTCDLLRNTKQKRLMKIISNVLKEHQFIKKFSIVKSYQQEKILDQYVLAKMFQNNQLIQYKMKIDQRQFQIDSETKEYVNNQSGIIFYQNLKLFQDNKSWIYIDAYATTEQVEQNTLFLKQIEWKYKINTSIFIKDKLIYRNYGCYEKESNQNKPNIEFTDVIEIYDTQNDSYQEIRRNEQVIDLPFIDNTSIVDIIEHRKGGTCIEFGNGYFIVGGFSNTKIMNIIEFIQIQDGGFKSAKIRKERLQLEEHYNFYPFEQNLVLKHQKQYLILGGNNYNSQTPYLNTDDKKSHQKALLLKFDNTNNLKFINLDVKCDPKYFCLQEKSENWIYLADQDCWLLIQKKYVKNHNPFIETNELSPLQFIEEQKRPDSEVEMIEQPNSNKTDNIEEERPRETRKYHYFEEYLVLSKIYVVEQEKNVVINKINNTKYILTARKILIHDCEIYKFPIIEYINFECEILFFIKNKYNFMDSYIISESSQQQKDLLTPFHKNYFFEQELHQQESPSLYDSIIDSKENYESLPLLTVIRYDDELFNTYDKQNPFLQGQRINIIEKIQNQNHNLDFAQQSQRNKRIIKIKVCTKYIEEFKEEEYTEKLNLLQIFQSMITTIQKNQQNQKDNTTVILVQGEWLECNTFQQAYTQLFNQQKKQQKNVFINLTGHDTARNIKEMKEINLQSDNIYISFVVEDLSLIGYNNPDEGIYIVPIQRKSKHCEIEFLFQEYFNELIENPEYIFLQLAVNLEFQINQYILQNIINKLDSISFKKLIIHLQFMNHNEILAQQLLQQYLQIYQAIIQGVQKCAPLQTLPNIFTNEDQMYSIEYTIINLKKQSRIQKMLKQYQREYNEILQFQIQQLQTNPSDRLKIDKKSFSTYSLHGKFISEIKLWYKRQTFQNNNTQEYIDNEEQIIFYSNLCQIDEMREKFTYIDCYAQYNTRGIELSIREGDGVAINQQEYELKLINWTRGKTNSIYYIKNKKIYKLYEQDDQDFIEIFFIETKEIKLLTRTNQIPKQIDYKKYLDKTDQIFMKMRLGGTCVEGPNDSILIIGGISKDEPKIMNMIEYLKTSENEFYSAKFKKQTLKIDKQMTFYPYQSNIVLKNNNQILILASTKSQTPYQFYYNQSSLQKAFLLIFDEELIYFPLTLEQVNKENDFYQYQEKTQNYYFLNDENCWLLIQKKFLANIDLNKNFKPQTQIQNFIANKNIIDRGKLIPQDDGKKKVDHFYNDSDVIQHFSSDSLILSEHAMLQQLLVLSKIYLDQENKKVFVLTECFRIEYKQYLRVMKIVEQDILVVKAEKKKIFHPISDILKIIRNLIQIFCKLKHYTNQFIFQFQFLNSQNFLNNNNINLQQNYVILLQFILLLSFYIVYKGDIDYFQTLHNDNLFGRNITACYNQQKQQLILESVFHEVEVKNGIAINIVRLTYQNDIQFNEIIHFLTQVPKNITVIGIKAKLGDQQFESIVKQTVLDQTNSIESMESDDYSDIIRLKLGNVSGQQSIEITYEYIEQLSVQVNEFWRIEINPMVQNYSHTQRQYLEQFFIIRNNNDYNLVIKIELDKSIIFHKSPTHQYEIINIGEKNIISINEDKAIDKNIFVLLLQNEQIHKPQLLLTHTTDEQEVNQQYCATIQFVPQFNKLKQNDAYQAYIQDNDIENQDFEIQTKGDGSMTGSRIQKAKQALILFIQSLPSDSFFNIISFGSSYQYQFQQSIEYKSDIEVKHCWTQKHIMLIWEVLTYNQLQKGYSRNIFLLTDGEDTVDPILYLVEQSSRPDVRFYSVGIGEGCNEFLIKKIAFLGNGLHGFVHDDGDLSKTIIIMLSDSIAPIYSNFKIQTNIPNQSISMIVSHFKQINAIKKNKPISFQVLFNFGDQQDYYIKITFEDDNMENQEITILLDKNNSQETEYLHKLAVQQEIQKVIEFAKIRQHKIQNFLEQKVNLNKQKLIDLSLKYQVVTPLTTLACAKKQVDNFKQINDKLTHLTNTNDSVMIPNKISVTPVDQIQNSRFINQYGQINQRSNQTQNQIQFFQNQSDLRQIKQSKLIQILDNFNIEGYFKLEVLDIIQMNHIDLSSLQGIDHQFRVNILTLKVLENQFYEQKSTWNKIFIKTKEYLMRNQINYNQVKNLINVPKSDMEQQEPETIFQQSELIQEFKNKFEKQYVQPLDPFKQKRLDQILDTFRANCQINQQILIILQYDKQKLIPDINSNSQLCILAIMTFENIFNEFEALWKEKVKQLKKFLSDNGVNYLELSKNLEMPQLIFDQQTQDQIDEQIKNSTENQSMVQSIRNKFTKQDSNATLNPIQQKNKELKLNQILNCFNCLGLNSQKLMQILQIDMNDIIINDKLDIQQTLAILTLAIFEEKYYDLKQIWLSRSLKLLNDLKDSQIDYKSDYQEN